MSTEKGTGNSNLHQLRHCLVIQNLYKEIMATKSVVWLVECMKETHHILRNDTLEHFINQIRDGQLVETFMLGRDLYECAVGEQQEHDAFFLVEAAAKGGYLPAYKLLADMFMWGFGTKQDLGQSNAWNQSLLAQISLSVRHYSPSVTMMKAKENLAKLSARG